MSNNNQGLANASSDLKQCSKCKELKSYSEFYKNKTRKDGYQSECKSCENQRHKQYNIENRDKINQYNKQYWEQYYIENRDRINQRQKQYNIENRDKYKQYCIENRDKINQRQKQYYIENRDKRKQYNKQYDIENRDKRKQYRLENRDKRNQYYKQYRQDNRDKLRASSWRYENKKKINKKVTFNIILFYNIIELCFDKGLNIEQTFEKLVGAKYEAM